MWQSLLTDVAFYFDEPTLRQEKKMKSTLQSKYDALFSEGWRPPLQTRNDLISWVCHQRNSFYQEKGAPESQIYPNCENPRELVEFFGPKYEPVKAKLGYIKGLYRE